jgi:hypothetical protein
LSKAAQPPQVADCCKRHNSAGHLQHWARAKI